jgi:hypothetical protein
MYDYEHEPNTMLAREQSYGCDVRFTRARDHGPGCWWWRCDAGFTGFQAYTEYAKTKREHDEWHRDHEFPDYYKVMS